MTTTTKARIETLHTTVLESLDGAFESESAEIARIHLTNALFAVRSLVRLGELNPAINEAVNETRVALMARGWC